LRKLITQKTKHHILLGVIILLILHSTAIPPSPTTPLENVMSTSISETSIEMKRKKFSYSEVMKMTNNFQRALGEGGFGTVYHGDLDSSQQVAVKLLSQSSTQGYKEFKAEVCNAINLLKNMGNKYIS